MPACPTLTLCDKLVTAIREAWLPTGDDEVTRVYEAPIELKNSKGRKVYVFPGQYGSEPADREADEYAHDVIVLTAERYTGAGAPPVAWVDERVDFVWERIWQGLDFNRDDGLLVWGGRSVWTAAAGPAEVYDADRLTGQRVFWSEVPLTFHEFLT